MKKKKNYRNFTRVMLRLFSGLEIITKHRTSHNESHHQTSVYDILHFVPLYRMDEKQLKASLMKYFGEATAKVTKETTEDEIKRIYAARSATYDEVL